MYPKQNNTEANKLIKNYKLKSQETIKIEKAKLLSVLGEMHNNNLSFILIASWMLLASV